MRVLRDEEREGLNPACETVSIGVEQHPAFRMIENLLHQTGMQRMSGSFGNQMSDKGQTQKGEVSDEIQDFMAHEFVGKPKTGFIQDARLAKGRPCSRGLPPRPSPRAQSASTSCKNPKVLAFRDLSRKRMRGMLIRIGLRSDQRMVVLDGIGDSWRGRRLDRMRRASIDDFQRPGNLQEGSTAVLSNYTGRSDESDEGAELPSMTGASAASTSTKTLSILKPASAARTCSIVLTWNPFPLIAVQSSVGTR